MVLISLVFYLSLVFFFPYMLHFCFGVVHLIFCFCFLSLRCLTVVLWCCACMFTVTVFGGAHM